MTDTPLPHIDPPNLDDRRQGFLYDLDKIEEMAVPLNPQGRHQSNAGKYTAGFSLVALVVAAVTVYNSWWFVCSYPTREETESLIRAGQCLWHGYINHRDPLPDGSRNLQNLSQMSIDFWWGLGLDHLARPLR